MLSGGGVAFAHNAEGAFQYLKRTCNGTTPDDILHKMAQEMVGMIDWLTGLAKVSGTEPTKTETRGHGTYPLGSQDLSRRRRGGGLCCRQRFERSRGAHRR